jgi:hypothetical protein
MLTLWRDYSVPKLEMHTWSDVLQSATTLVFDCDGVVLNSNRIKTEAFRLVAAPYGEAAAEALVQYHLAIKSSNIC